MLLLQPLPLLLWLLLLLSLSLLLLLLLLLLLMLLLLLLLQSLRETAACCFLEVFVEGVCRTSYWIVFGLSAEES